MTTDLAKAVELYAAIHLTVIALSHILQPKAWVNFFVLAVNPLNFHPLENTATTAISSTDLMKFAAGCGHKPLTLRFPRRTAEAISET